MKALHHGRIRLAAAVSAAAVATSFIVAPTQASAQRPPEGGCCYTTTVTATSLDAAVAQAIATLERLMQIQLEYSHHRRLGSNTYEVGTRQAG